MVTFVDGDDQEQSADTASLSLAELIEGQVLLPIISGEAIEDMVFGSNVGLLERYAKFVKYPFADRGDLAKVAKYRRLRQKVVAHDLKSEFLGVAATHVLEAARTAGVPQSKIDEARAQAGGLTLTEFAERMGWPRFGNDPCVAPLEILANLDLPLFVTTSPYTFLEAALRNAGKEPRTEFCRWLPALGSPSVFAPNEGGAVYAPTEKQPLVYHLYGLDRYAASLVLTEDDYLDYLVAIAQNRGKDVDPVHSAIKDALQTKSMLLLGFSLSSWAFRTLYQGLIKPMPATGTYRRLCCLQLVPNEDEKRYYETYLDDTNFFPYWKDVAAFCQEDLVC